MVDMRGTPLCKQSETSYLGYLLLGMYYCTTVQEFIRSLEWRYATGVLVLIFYVEQNPFESSQMTSCSY